MSGENRDTEPQGALTGLRVIDLTSRKGAYCGLLLANLGAEVILIEPPGGDAMRSQGPFKGDVADAEGSLAFAAYHTNKQGIVLDLESQHGRETVCDFVAGADVMIEDKSAGYLAGIGLGFDSLKAINAALVLTSITGFGLSAAPIVISKRRISWPSPWAA